MSTERPTDAYSLEVGRQKEKFRGLWKKKGVSQKGI